jgi:hypothetical protein
LQQGTVLAIEEYSAKIRPELPPGPVVTAIEKAEPRSRETSREYDG